MRERAGDKTLHESAYTPVSLIKNSYIKKNTSINISQIYVDQK